MQKPAKVALGILNIVPFAYFPLFFLFTISMAATQPEHTTGPPKFIFFIFGMHIMIMLLIFTLMVVYIINLFNNNRVPGDKKALWAVVLFMGNLIAYPFYWYFYIWSEPKAVTGVPEVNPASADGKIYCQKCGTQNDDYRYKCTSCGFILHLQAQSSSGNINYNSVGSIIPYKNTPAISAYYLGVFSAIPGIGILLGIAAFILGLKGRRIAREHPERKGIAHAWAGIILGGFFCIGYLIGLIILAGKLSGSG